MKKVILVLSFLAICQVDRAGTILGNGGGTEVTQILNNIALVTSYAKQVQQYTTQGLQLESELKNLMANPSSMMSNQPAMMIQQISGMMSAGQAMGGNLASIDARFASTFGNAQAGNFSQQFSQLNQTSKDTLQASMRTAGLHRDQYATDSDAITALYNQSQSTNGTLDSLQTLAQVNIKILQQLQGLRDLMASQNLATSTYMAAQTAKEQSGSDKGNQTAQAALQSANIPTLSAGTQTYQKWNLYPPK